MFPEFPLFPVGVDTSESSGLPDLTQFGDNLTLDFQALGFPTQGDPATRFEFSGGDIIQGDSREFALRGGKGIQFALPRDDSRFPALSDSTITRGGGKAMTIRKKIRTYKMNRNIKTVALAWDEYKIGLQGDPPVESLVLAYKAKWRKYPCPIESNTEAVFFKRRLKLFRAIAAVMTEEGISEAAAVNRFEKRRGNSTLDALQKSL
jgi:hypothetical protein